MKTMFWLLLLICNLSQAEIWHGKDGGNGQLVIIPKNAKEAVPYEAIRAWETGKYLNFYRLPGVKGVIEPREKFNRLYGVHALRWLEEIKFLSPKLYAELVKAATSTSFRIVSENIAWNKKAEKNGTLDYKKYEKAAYYNNEIILSTPVMDRLGALSNVLTKEQSQALVVISQLVNVAYQDKEPEYKEKITDAITRQKIYNESQLDFTYNLLAIDTNFIIALPDSNDFLNIIDELINYEEDQNKRSQLLDYQKIGITYGYSNEPLKVIFLKEVKQDCNLASQVSVNKIAESIKVMNLGVRGDVFWDIDTLKEIAKNCKAKTNFYSLSKLIDPHTGSNLLNEASVYISERFNNFFMTNLGTNLEIEIQNSINLYKIDTVLGDVQDITDHYAKVTSVFSEVADDILSKQDDIENLGFKVFANDKKDVVFKEIEEEFKKVLFEKYENELCKFKYCVDFKKTIDYKKWHNDLSYGGSFRSIPLRVNDELLIKYYYTDDLKVTLIDIKKNRIQLCSNKFNEKKMYYNLKNNSIGSNDKGIDSLNRIIILK